MLLRKRMFTSYSNQREISQGIEQFESKSLAQSVWESYYTGIQTTIDVLPSFSDGDTELLLSIDRQAQRAIIQGIEKM